MFLDAKYTDWRLYCHLLGRSPAEQLPPNPTNHEALLIVRAYQTCGTEDQPDPRGIHGYVDLWRVILIFNAYMSDPYCPRQMTIVDIQPFDRTCSNDVGTLECFSSAVGIQLRGK